MTSWTKQCSDICSGDDSLTGHNVVPTGQAGTGKTFLLREVVNALKFIGKNIRYFVQPVSDARSIMSLVPQLFTGMNVPIPFQNIHSYHNINR